MKASLKHFPVMVLSGNFEEIEEIEIMIKRYSYLEMKKLISKSHKEHYFIVFYLPYFLYKGKILFIIMSMSNISYYYS